MGKGEGSEMSGFVFGAVAVILTCASSCSVFGALVSTCVCA